MAAQSQQPGGSGKSRFAATGPIAVLSLLALLVGAGYLWHATKDDHPAGAAKAPPGDNRGADASPAAGHPAGRSGAVGAVGAVPTTAPSAAPSSVIPMSGSGRFTTAKASGKKVGRGKIVRRYKVEVEQGTGVSAEAAAAAIQKILGDPRGWTTDGVDSFQLVSSGSYDFEVKIATPDTTDRLCLVGGLHTHGEVNCDVGSQVLVNLKRWVQGSPEFDGPIGEYRALIINHEVGHRIGHGHEGCPGPGRPAPAMMQQIDGLHGCVANAWPYDAHGHYLGGPHIP